MEKIDEKALDFVVKYYQEGKLDTLNAIKTFRHLIGEKAVVRPIHRYIAIAASLLVLIGLAIGWYITMNDERTVLASANDIETYKLPDSTIITLAPHSSISFSYIGMKNGRRSVDFNGKAYFKVKHDKEHPFDVYGSISHVRVLGTVFQIDESAGNNSCVTLISGKVFFGSRNAENGVILTDGMTAKLGINDSVPNIVSSKNKNETVWVSKVFRFDDATITEVLNQLSKYYHVKLSASDKTKRVSGEFEAGELSNVISMLENMLDIRIVVKR